MRGPIAITWRRLLGLLTVALAAAAIGPAAASAELDATGGDEFATTTDQVDSTTDQTSSTLAAPSGPTIVERPVTFTVQNVNRTQVPCQNVNGATYTLRGTLVAPTSRLSSGNRDITLWLHGLTASGNFLYRLKSVPGYDFAREEALKGHAALVLDSLGYGTSDIPDGRAFCLGSHADMAHQVIGKLRSGAYTMSGGAGMPWERVGLGGASMGGLVAEIETYTFGDAATEINIGWADGGFSPTFDQGAAQFGDRCNTAPEPKTPGAAGNYVYTFDDPAVFYQSANPAVVAAHRVNHERDACGIASAFFQAVGVTHTAIGTITKPVLLVYGADDQLYLPGTFDAQKTQYSSATDLTMKVTANAGHVPILDGPAPTVRQQISDWLSARGF
ncbi:MAG TPA: hypothetical protein VF545_11055 [Thermoleophilaceae bacterium]|jgi:pimeloyl-ACP methyl ester carboxylesterase